MEGTLARTSLFEGELQRHRTDRAVLTILLVASFVVLRLLAGGRSLEVEKTSLQVTLLGLSLLAGLTLVNRPVALALMIFDMTDMAGWLNPDAWGIPGAFKFKDAEFILLMSIGIIGLLANSRLRGTVKNTPFVRMIVGLLALASAYIVWTLSLQGVPSTFRVARPVIYLALFLVVPFYVQSKTDLILALKFFFILMVVSSVSQVLQAVFLPEGILLPFLQSQSTSAGIVRLWGAPTPFNFVGITALFAYVVRTRKFTFPIASSLAVCFLATVLSLSRTYIAYVFVGLFIVVLVVSSRGVLLRNAVRFLGIIVVALLSVWLVLVMFGKGHVVSDAVTGRIENARMQFVRGEGTFFGHTDYVFLAPLFIERSAGNLLSGVGFRDLNYSRLPVGGSAQEKYASSFNSDNGWAGIFVSMGIVGVLFFLYFLASGARYTFRLSKRVNSLMVGTLAPALFVFFALAPFLWFFSAIGIWQDSSFVLAVAMGLLERALSLHTSGLRVAKRTIGSV